MAPHITFLTLIKAKSIFQKKKIKKQIYRSSKAFLVKYFFLLVTKSSLRILKIIQKLKFFKRLWRHCVSCSNVFPAFVYYFCFLLKLLDWWLYNFCVYHNYSSPLVRLCSYSFTTGQQMVIAVLHKIINSTKYTYKLSHFILIAPIRISNLNNPKM